MECGRHSRYDRGYGYIPWLGYAFPSVSLRAWVSRSARFEFRARLLTWLGGMDQLGHWMRCPSTISGGGKGNFPFAHVLWSICGTLRTRGWTFSEIAEEIWVSRFDLFQFVSLSRQGERFLLRQVFEICCFKVIFEWFQSSFWRSGASSVRWETCCFGSNHLDRFSRAFSFICFWCLVGLIGYVGECPRALTCVPPSVGRGLRAVWPINFSELH